MMKRNVRTRGTSGSTQLPGRAGQQQRREKLHGDDYLGAEEKNHFDGGFPGARNEEEHAARGDGGDENEPEARKQAEAESGAAAFHVQARLDVRFERVEVLMDRVRDARGRARDRRGRGTRRPPGRW